MGLFDKGIPAGMQAVIVQLIKQAAPDLASHIDEIGTVVKVFNAKLDDVIAKQSIIIRQNAAIMRALNIEGEEDGGRTDQRSIEARN